MKIEGKVALVAGGGSGLGRATCMDLASAGARVGVLDADPAAAREVANSLPEGFGIQVDVTDADAVGHAVDEVLDAFGALHIAVTTAGVVSGARIVSRGRSARQADFERVVAINLFGTFNVMRTAAAVMVGNEPIDGERGVIVNTASGAAFEGQSGQAAYSASKAGVIALAMPVARDLAGTGVRVNTVAPGLFETPMAAGLPESTRLALEAAMIEPARLGRPEEFALLVRQMVENPYLNAECVRLDAAIRMPPR
ncbi:SDR family NAD(P)-dependent oxidoreductase [Pseudonocardia sp. NPDC049635]|uniref:SDR family NAD(P)-dependent oxidoreductase n=1 Tax=Pseudonocardia sp. NPDC049635 TaxID=3155506 RepID=UPI0033DE1342